MPNQTAIDLSQWLIGRDHVGLVVAVTVELLGQARPGAKFAEDADGCFAERLYILGELPPLFRQHERRIVFRAGDSGQDWLVTSWHRRIAANTEIDEASPYGSHLILTLYSSLDAWASEQCGEHIRRLQMTITEVGPILSNPAQYDDEETEEDDTDDNDFHQWG